MLFLLLDEGGDSSDYAKRYASIIPTTQTVL